MFVLDPMFAQTPELSLHVNKRLGDVCEGVNLDLLPPLDLISLFRCVSWVNLKRILPIIDTLVLVTIGTLMSSAAV